MTFPSKHVALVFAGGSGGATARIYYFEVVYGVQRGVQTPSIVAVYQYQVPQRKNLRKNMGALVP